MKRIRFVIVFVLAALTYAQEPLSPPLKNWIAPLYWAPQPHEVERHDLSALAQPASIFTAPGPMTFIAMTPCRVMDT
jgi:hypothetical protein